MSKLHYMLLSSLFFAIELYAQATTFRTHERQMRRGVETLTAFLENPGSASSAFSCSDSTNEELQNFCRVGSMGASATTAQQRMSILQQACSSFSAQGGMSVMEQGQNAYMEMAFNEFDQVRTRLYDQIYKPIGITSVEDEGAKLSSSIARLRGTHPATEQRLLRCVIGVNNSCTEEEKNNSPHEALAAFKSLDDQYGSKLNNCYLRACPQQSGFCAGEISVANIGAAVTGHRATCSSGVSPTLNTQPEIEASIQWANNNRNEQCVRLCRNLNSEAASQTGGERGNLYSSSNLSKLRGMRDQLKVQFTAVINEMHITPEAKAEMVRKLHAIDLGAPNASRENWHAGFNGLCRDRAGHNHNADSSVIMLSPAYMAMLGSSQGKAMVMRVLAHEMSHAIDRKVDGTRGDASSWNSQTPPLNSCLERNWNIGSYNSSAQNNQSLHIESFADNMSSMVMEKRYESEIAGTPGTSLTDSENRKALLANTCMRISTDGQYSDTTHPINVDRATHYLQGTHARELLGCNDQVGHVPPTGACNGQN